jgi:beta-glucosidase/6-phospho-beta-glucosidase/beta-galactosidase
LKILSGFESTQIHGSGGRDVLQLTRHTEFYREDLELVRACGLDTMRYSVPWHTVEREPDVYDWRWVDEALGCMRRLGINPILDPLHHTSFPEWLDGGFANPQFARLYLKFVTAIAERYPWVTDYTVINEPFVTTFFCGHQAIWYPYLRGGKNFVPMILNVGEAISLCSRMLAEKIPGARLIHVDACEKHRATDAFSIERAELKNELRFLVQDLILGKIDERHTLYPYLRKFGATKKRLRWFQENPARIDVIGLDYYAHCELEWNRRGRIYPNRNPEGFAAVAMDYVNRFELPVMLSETNIRGHVTDRISWLKFMVEQCEILQRRIEPRSISFEGFCWYPFIDSTDWCSLVREAKGLIDPQGIICLEGECFARRSSELSEIFSALARGEITSRDIPAYQFRPPLSRVLKSLMPFMEHWQWRSPLTGKFVRKRPPALSMVPHPGKEPAEGAAQQAV